MMQKVGKCADGASEAFESMLRAMHGLLRMLTMPGRPWTQMNQSGLSCPSPEAGVGLWKRKHATDCSQPPLTTLGQLAEARSASWHPQRLQQQAVERRQSWCSGC